ncbi:hypothetical protein BC831DRAFT_437397 [Entophlyctis helioformis]|nr:hypothetical protein BC831DRAFT_437397 [Entophlyctis helioformis]
MTTVRRKHFFLAPRHKRLVYLILVQFLVQAKHDFLESLASKVHLIAPDSELASKIQQQIGILKDLVREAVESVKNFDPWRSSESRDPQQVDDQGVPRQVTNGGQPIQGRAKRAFDDAVSLIKEHASQAASGDSQLTDLVSASRLPVRVRACVVQAEFDASVPVARAASAMNTIAVSANAAVPFTPGCKYTLRLGNHSDDLISQAKIVEAAGFKRELDLAVFASVSGCDYANPMFEFQTAWDLVVYLSRRLPIDLEDRARHLLDLYTKVVDKAVSETIDMTNDSIAQSSSARAKAKLNKTLEHWRQYRARPHDSKSACDVFMHGIESNGKPSALLSDLLEKEGITPWFGIAPVQNDAVQP